MKQLLGMARQKKGNQPIIKAPVHQPQPQEFEYDDYEPNQEQILGYAQFIGIQLPEEIDLLYIAEEGINAPLPPEWEAQELGEEEVYYINTRTGQKTADHPCDQYYRQLVLRERKKRGKTTQKGFQPPVGLGSINHNLNLNLNLSKQKAQQVQQAPIDPLIKMEQEKRLKKLQQQKKTEFQGKKKEMVQKYEDKKQKIQKQHKSEQQKTKLKYQQDENTEKKKMLKKMSQKERQVQTKNQQALNAYEKQTKMKIQKESTEKLAVEKQKMDRKLKQKKEEIRIKLESQFKKSKKEIDQQYDKQLKQMEHKEKALVKESQQESLQTSLQRLKDQIVRKKMKEHSDLLHQQRKKQQATHQLQVKEMLHKHEQRIAQLQNRKPQGGPNQNTTVQDLIREIERQEKIQVKELQCELQVLKELKRVQNEQKLEQFKMECQIENGKKVKELMAEHDKIRGKYRDRKQQQYRQKMWEEQKRIKEQYLRAIKAIQSKYEVEEEIAIRETKQRDSQNANDLQHNSLEAMERVITNLNWDEKQLRKQLQYTQLEIENLKSQQQSVVGKLNQNQMQLYKLIQDKIRSNSRKHH